ncbi:MAG TPA: ATP-binding cassette domain-containing protein [Marinobacter sp.]|uniref:ATP-binding cassette domain-containing protein n=1 Tax=Marinobacter antarcticus TaxID=564117 RepID=A0A831R2P6_9GAMM|nr:ATP-binding cassette domain-containing protein [Marinobacter antarcticus]HDZ39603.1 ATP-binding cassette domain-containing protein [Marinobacter sp.]HEA51085.1 ATP-binding cassette domain-containing protein [Marinobacter antarcticus]
MTESLLVVRGLSKRFASADEIVPVVEKLSFTLGQGQSLALTGRSGSGKSTLLNLLCGLELPDAGTITLRDQVFEASGAGAPRKATAWSALRRKHIGVVFQEANLMPALSLLDNVRLRAQLAGRDPAHSEDWLTRLDIGELARRYPDQVSGGQRQRAALAMVFAMEPALILADEPTGSLDRHTSDEVTRVLFDLQARYGCSLILATHDAELAAACEQHLDLGHQRTP